MHTKLQIKGIKEGLLIALGEGNWDEARSALMAHLHEQADFLRGGQLILDVGNRVLHPVEVSTLRDQISAAGLTLWAILSNSPVTERTAQSLGLATRINKPPDEPQPAARGETFLMGEAAVLIRRTLRSGFSLQHKGHVVVIGDANPGSEIIAGGDVVVWGRLLGMVHAGAEGNEQAVVCALDLSPTQLRIADHIAIAPKRRGKPQPEMAFLQDGQIIAQPWKLGSA
jgi:septum site-determining protein MinC